MTIDAAPTHSASTQVATGLPVIVVMVPPVTKEMEVPAARLPATTESAVVLVGLWSIIQREKHTNYRPHLFPGAVTSVIIMFPSKMIPFALNISSKSR